MSGNYVIHCSCGHEETIEPQQVRSETIETAMELMPQFEKMRDAGWDMSELRGCVYEHASHLVRVMLGHWRHGQLSYSYDNNSNPPVVLPPPPEAGLPVPCGICQGRRLVACPACDGGDHHLDAYQLKIYRLALHDLYRSVQPHLEAHADPKVMQALDHSRWLLSLHGTAPA
jgi:hypothetical protein